LLAEDMIERRRRGTKLVVLSSMTHSSENSALHSGLTFSNRASGPRGMRKFGSYNGERS
jgi:hypothetical protein